MKRHIDNELQAWADEQGHKVLLVRGARQVGKTYSIRELGKKFPHFIEINFEESSDVAGFFKSQLNPGALCEKISIYTGKPIIPGKTLLFFDEIQACPDALRSLRFFFEQMPELHVIAAGSMLEFALSEIPSFGVGRISSLYMYPLSFNEFLEAEGRAQLVEAKKNAGPDNPLDATFHDLLLDRLRIFLLTGGMPEAVKKYLETGDFAGVAKVHDDLINAYQDDFAKYKKIVPATRLREVFRSIVSQGGSKFKYSSIGSERPALYKQALDFLILAGLAYPIYHSAARGLPLGAQVNEKKMKVLLYDTGIFLRLSGIDLPSYITLRHEELVNKGALAELHVGLEMTKNQKSNSRPELFYWHREARSSNAEVDYVLRTSRGITPVEVKAGSRGTMQSMNLFLSERKLQFGIRVSANQFGRFNSIVSVPLYSAGELISY